MSCQISLGRALNCKDTVGGISEVWITTSDLGALTIGNTDEVTDIAGTSITLFQYDVKGANGLETTVNSSNETGTTFMEAVLTLQLPKLTKEDAKELKLLAYSRPRIFVKTRNGDVLLMGEKYGSELTSGSITSGQALGDFNGINLAFTAQESLAPRFVTLANATDANPFAGESEITVTLGTNS
jgi:hypothetical protein